MSEAEKDKPEPQLDRNGDEIPYDILKDPSKTDLQKKIIDRVLREQQCILNTNLQGLLQKFAKQKRCGEKLNDSTQSYEKKGCLKRIDSIDSDIKPQKFREGKTTDKGFEML